MSTRTAANRANGRRNVAAQQGQLTLGTPVQRDQYVAADLQGKYMGYGTYANRGQFNTKENVLVTPEWAQLFNQRLSQQIQAANAAAQQGIADFSAGIYGVTPSGARFYVPGIQQYYPDDRARVSISAADIGGTRAVALPGSTEARNANDNGLAIGLAFVKNPQNRTGYVRVGSQGWRNALTRYVNGSYAANEADMQHLFGQGAAYGLGPVYALYGIDIVALPDPQNGPVRYRVAGNTPISQIVANDNLMRNIQTYYDNYLVSPDQQKLGRYGYANLALRQADKMTTGATGSAANQQAVQQAVLNAFQQNQSAAGAARWGSAGGKRYTSAAQRRGLTANPLRSADGTAIDPAQSRFASAGECNIYGSGPLVQQQATLGGETGYRFYKERRNHVSKGKNTAGAVLADPTYFCGPNPSYVVNPDRAIYAAGGARGGNVGLSTVLDSVGGEYSTANQQRKYQDWINNPQAYGTNPAFVIPGRGFARWAPAELEQQMTPEQAAAFNQINLTQARKVDRSNQLAQAARQGTYVPDIGKTSAPTSANGRRF